MSRLADEARAAAGEAADRLGVQVRELSEMDDQRAAARLLQRVWDADSPDRLVNTSLMRALSHSGNYVAGAYRDGHLLGAAVAFIGDGHLHSHIAGVAPGRQGAGVGYAMKLHQRAWALDRGLPAICWTYDPLVRRNAYFNLCKLGARATAYLPDFYGPMDVGTDAGPSDRMYVRWELTSPGATAAARGELREADPAGGVVVLGRDEAGGPVPGGGVAGRLLLVAVPSDVEALRRTDPPVAGRWRYALREAVTVALARGYTVAGVTRDGWYVLEAA